MVWRFLSGKARKREPRIPSGLRVYAIGDIHGRIDLLDEVVAKIDRDLQRHPVERPLEIYLGDYIDRGPASRQVLERLILRRQERQSIYIKGNHEAFALELLRDPTILAQWREVGGTETLLSYGLRISEESQPAALAKDFEAALPPAHRHFLESLALTFSCGDFCFVHAGVRPGIALSDQKEEDLIWIRDEFLLSEVDFGKIIVHGHTPVSEPDFRKNRINIDTGAYVTNRLTCLVIEQDQLQIL